MNNCIISGQMSYLMFSQLFVECIQVILNKMAINNRLKIYHPHHTNTLVCYKLSAN